jgi:hypothetical protein
VKKTVDPSTIGSLASGPLKKAIDLANLEGFAAFCLGLQLENGRPLELYPEQLLMLGDYFDGEADNGKTIHIRD